MKLKLVSICAVLALALAPVGVFGAQMFGVGFPIWSVQKSLNASGCITTASGGSTCAAFPAGSGVEHKSTITVVSAAAGGVCCWTADSTFTVTTGLLSNSAQGSCFRLQAAGQTWHSQPDWAKLVAYSGTSISGLCGTAVTHGFQTVHQPCDGDEDCASGACTAAASVTAAQKRSAGLYLVCVPTTGTVIFEAVKDKIDQ